MNATSHNPQLKKEIRLSQLFTYSFGFLVGFGWIVMTGIWISMAGAGGAAVAFFLGGLLLIPIGLCYVELATTLPFPGGEFVYVYHAFGRVAAFVTAWVLLFLFVSLTAFETVAAAWIITIILPFSSGIQLYEILGFPVTAEMFAIMLLGVTIVTAVNYRGARIMANFQDGVTYILAGTTTIIIASGLLLGKVENLIPFFYSSNINWAYAGAVSVFITTPIWYSGINALPHALSELTTAPRPKTLSRLVTVMLIGSSLFYFLIILSVGMAVNRDELAGVDFATAVALEKLFESRMAGIFVLLAGLLGIVSTWNAAHFAASRIMFSMSRSCLLAERFSRLHDRFGCPHVAVIFVGAIGFLGACGGLPMIGAIVGTGVIVVSLLFLSSCCSLFRLRARNVSIRNIYRVPLYPWLPVFGLLYAGCTVVFALIVTWENRRPETLPTEWLVLAIWAGLGAMMWIAARGRRNSISEDDRAKLIKS